MANKKQGSYETTFDVTTPVETSQGKTHWFNLGRAWENVKDGKRRVLIKLNAHPVGDTLYLFERVEGEERLPHGNAPDNNGFHEDIPH
jgi:hypothetical protein